MDDLEVVPMSTISGIKLLKSFGIADIASLQEETVQLGNNEALKILTAALRSKTLLTDVFLRKKNVKKRKAKEAFRHEAVSRVVNRRGAWAGPWRPWYLSWPLHRLWFAPQCQLHRLWLAHEVEVLHLDL